MSDPQSALPLPPPYGIIRDKLNRGSLVPFLGAGASTAAYAGMTGDREVPDSGTLAQSLAKGAGYPGGDGFNLASVAQYFALMGGRNDLHLKLREEIAAHVEPGPDSIHAYLAEIDRPLLIVTTNYDTLVEAAFRKQGRVFDVVVQGDGRSGDFLWQFEHGAAEPRQVTADEVAVDLDTRTCIYKMHGSISSDAAKDSFVITEDDYVEFMGAMIRNAAIPNVFFPLLQTRPLMFVGYSLRDWNLRVLLSRLNKVRPFDPTAAPAYSIQLDVSPVERRIWQKRGVETFQLDIASFVRTLRNPS